MGNTVELSIEKIPMVVYQQGEMDIKMNKQIKYS